MSPNRAISINIQLYVDNIQFGLKINDKGGSLAQYSSERASKLRIFMCS